MKASRQLEVGTTASSSSRMRGSMLSWLAMGPRMREDDVVAGFILQYAFR